MRVQHLCQRSVKQRCIGLCFSQFSIHRDCLKNLLEHRLLGSIVRYSASRNWTQRLMWILAQRSHFEQHWYKGHLDHEVLRRVDSWWDEIQLWIRNQKLSSESGAKMATADRIAFVRTARSFYTYNHFNLARSSQEMQSEVTA